MSCLPRGDAAPPRPVLVAEVAVGVEDQSEQLGALGEALGPKPGGLLRQIGFRGRPSTHVDRGRQPLKEPADHLHMTLPDPALALHLRGRGQQRRQPFPAQRPARAQIGRLGHPPRRLSARDPQPVGHHMRQLAAQLPGIRLLGSLIDQLMLGHRQPPLLGLQDFEQVQPFRAGQRVIGVSEDPAHRGAQHREIVQNVVAINRTHIRILTRPTDRKPTATTVTQVISPWAAMPRGRCPDTDAETNKQETLTLTTASPKFAQST
jgi:hypothetical protein